MLKTRDLLYDLLQDKIRGQTFYNGMMVRMVNPRARDLFKTLRDEEDRELLAVRSLFLALEAKPMVLKFFSGRKPGG